jgi:N6-adenosine-specific RNA methylase IME4
MTEQRFNCIVVDPPWPYEARMQGTLEHGSGPMFGAKMPYKVMSIEQICELPIHTVAAADCHLYLWTTQRFLQSAYVVLSAWKFKQGAVLVWSKPPKGVVGTYVSSTEFCIFARKGHLAHKKETSRNLLQLTAARTAQRKTSRVLPYV